MREYQNEAQSSNDTRRANLLGGHWWDRLPNAHRKGGYRVTTRFHSNDRDENGSWVDNHSAWFTYQVTRTILFCGLFGVYLGQSALALFGTGWLI